MIANSNLLCNLLPQENIPLTLLMNFIGRLVDKVTILIENNTKGGLCLDITIISKFAIARLFIRLKCKVTDVD